MKKAFTPLFFLQCLLKFIRYNERRHGDYVGPLRIINYPGNCPLLYRLRQLSLLVSCYGRGFSFCALRVRGREQ